MVNSPHLLRTLDISVASPAALPSFCQWLVHCAAGRVQRLRLDLRAPRGARPESALRSFDDARLLFDSLQVRPGLALPMRAVPPAAACCMVPHPVAHPLHKPCLAPAAAPAVRRRVPARCMSCTCAPTAS